MSVESYLESIRKNTNSTTQKTTKLETTLKNLLNYETLKRAVAGGMDESKSMDRLAEISQKILTSQNATVDELKIANDLMLEFFASFKNGTATATSESWIKAMKEVLDEFGESLPEKFQKRLQNDLASTAAGAGADGKQVLKELQDAQKSQTEILQAIYENMKNKEQLQERKAEAEKPKILDEKRTQESFWKFTMNTVTKTLTGIFGKLKKSVDMLGLIFIGLAVFGELKKAIQDGMRAIFEGSFVMRITSGFKQLLKIVKTQTFSPKRIPLSAQTEARVGTLKNARPLVKNVKRLSTISKTGRAMSEAEALPGILRGAGGAIGKIAGLFSKLLLNIAKISRFVGNVLKIGRVMLAGLGKFTVILTAIMAIYDFLEGFVKTQGTVGQKIIGGLKNMVFKFFSSIGTAISWLFVKLPIKVVKGVFQYFKKGLGNITKDVKNGIIFWLKSVWSMILIPIRDFLEEIGAADEKSKLNDAYKTLKEWTKDPLEGSESTKKSQPMKNFKIDANLNMGSFSGGAAYGSGIYDSVPTTPLQGSNIRGINKGHGVILSSQSTDFIKRAGITERITSGMDGDHAGTASDPRSHYSGNKFDMDVSTGNAKAFANTVEKLLRTPGLVEIRTEKIPYSTVEGGRAILQRRGLDTSRLINDKYPPYATGPHLDVLIDPKQSGSGISSAENIQTSISNSIKSMLETQMIQAYNERVALFKNIKSPEQLMKQQLENANKELAKMSTQIGDSTSAQNSITFNKKTDITDANLAALQIFKLG